MNTKILFPRHALFLGLALVLSASAGCRHKPQTPAKSTMPVTEVQAPAVTSAPRSTVDPKEKRLQEQINLMQEQLGPMTARTEALARFYGSQMGPNWVGKVQRAREDASSESERLRYLEATKALLARRLNALRAEMKVYEEFAQSDPAVPRP